MRKKWVFLLIVSLFVVSCSPVIESSDEDYVEHTENVAKGHDEYMFPVPKDEVKVVRQTDHSLYASVDDLDKCERYFADLEQDWQLIKPQNENSPISFWKNGGSVLVVTCDTFSGIEIDLRIEYYQGKKESDISEEIQDRIRDFFSEETVYFISEYDIKDASDRMGLTGFYVITDKAEPVKMIVDRSNNLILANYDQYAIIDIDHDGEDELITRLGFGSGIYRVTFSVWKYDNNNELALLARTIYEQTGSEDMRILSDEDSVKVVLGTWSGDCFVPREEIGNLIINENGVVPSKEDGIPFIRK